MAKKLSVLELLNNYEIFAKKTRIDHWNCTENSRFVTVKCTDVLKVVKTSSSSEADTTEIYEQASPASPLFPARRRLKAVLRSRNSNIESSNAAIVTPLCVKDAGKKSTAKDTNKPGTVEQLIAKVPSIENDFIIKKRIGFGTFSTVYLANKKTTDLEGENRYYALKHICKASSNQKRVLFEAKCLKQIGGCENVVTLKNIVRHNNEHVFVMPYCRADKFVSLIKEMSFNEVRNYMKQLLTALRRVHKFNVIHRDVKPSNFLYDMKNKRGVLVDFGLAHKASYYKTGKQTKISSPPRMKSTPLPEINRAKPLRQITNTLQDRCSPLHTRSLSMVALAKSKNHHNKGIATRKRSAEDDVNGASKRIYTENLQVTRFRSVPKPSEINKDPRLCPGTPIPPRVTSRPVFETRGIPLFLPLPTTPSPGGNSTGSDRVFTSPSPAMCFSNDGKNLFNIAASKNKPRAGKTVGDVIPSLRKLRVESKLGKSSKSQIYKENSNECLCNGKLTCLQCNIRLSTTAPRAGTSGFRSPEVLIQCPHQTTAVDIWSAGVIFLSLLTGHYPLFKTTNDVESLAQIITIFGTERIKQVARACSKRLSMSYFCPPNDLKTVVETLRDVSGKTPDKFETRANSTHTNSPFTNKSTTSEKSSHREIVTPPYPVQDIPQSTYDLLSGLLDVNPLTRLSAEQALDHAFFNEKSS